MPTAVLGMRGSGSFAGVERPKSWREQILLQFPNGDAPLTALLSKLREQEVNDPEFSWFEKGIPQQRARILGASVTTSAAPASGADIAAASASADIVLTLVPDGATAGTSDVSIFKPGHVLFNQVGDEAYLIVKVDRSTNFVTVRRNLGSTYTLGVNTPAITGDTAAGDTVVIIGSGHPEGASIGSAISYASAKYRNFTQIHRTPLMLTRTARRTKLRTDARGPYREAQREALQIHAIEMERSFFFGEASENTSLSNPDGPLDVTSAGQPLRTTRGILRWLPAITTASVSVHTDLTTYNSGIVTEKIFDDFCEEVFRYGAKEKVGFVGSTGLNVMTQMAKNKATIDLVPTDQTYGMHMMRYLTPFGVLYLVNHPLLSVDPVWRRDLFVVDLDKLTYRYITDTDFVENRQNPGDDASKDEFITEAGLECHFSGHAPDADSPNTIATPAAHGRLKGMASYGG